MRRIRVFVPLVVMTALTVGAALLALEQSPARSVAGDAGAPATVTSHPKDPPSATSPPVTTLPPTTTTVQPPVTVVGMTVAAAAAVELRTGRHLEVQVQREEVETSVAPGTIVSQGGVSGSAEPSSPPSVLVNVTVGVSPAPPCTATQLAMAFLGGQGFTGNDAGFLVVRDTSAQWCSLNGPVQVWGQAATGRLVTNKLTEPVPVPIVMSPRTVTPVPFISATAPGVLQAAVEFAANENGCIPPNPAEPTPTVRVVPAALDLSMPGGIVLTTPNRSYAKEGVPHFIACNGRIVPSPAPTAVSVRG